METLNVGADTWRDIRSTIGTATDATLGQILNQIDQKLDDPKYDELNQEMLMTVRMIDAEFEVRELSELDIRVS